MRCQVRQRRIFFKKMVIIWPYCVPLLFRYFYFSFPYFYVERINNSTGTVSVYHDVHNLDGFDLVFRYFDSKEVLCIINGSKSDVYPFVIFTI